MEKLKSEMIKEQIDALENYRKQLQGNERIFLKVSGISESIEQYRAEISRLETSQEAKKEDLAELKAEKADAVKDTLIAMQDKISELLPMGDGIVHLQDDGKLIIGWLKPGKTLVPYEGLSGGEKILFGAALSNAFFGKATNKVLLIEGAEIDDKNLEKQLKVLEEVDNDTQVVLSTCHIPENIPKSFHIIELT